MVMDQNRKSNLQMWLEYRLYCQRRHHRVHGPNAADVVPSEGFIDQRDRLIITCFSIYKSDINWPMYWDVYYCGVQRSSAYPVEKLISLLFFIL